VHKREQDPIWSLTSEAHSLWPDVAQPTGSGARDAEAAAAAAAAKVRKREIASANSQQDQSLGLSR